MTKPRVTEIIKAVGLGKDFSGVDPFYKERGSAVHLAIHYYLKGTLDLDSLDPACKPYFEGFLKWWEKNKTDKFESEVTVENEDYYGTPDLVTTRIWDFKCSKSHDPVAELQGAGYKKLKNNAEPFTVVQLPGDGSYKEIEYKSHWYLWDAVWELYCWKKHV